MISPSLFDSSPQTSNPFRLHQDEFGQVCHDIREGLTPHARRIVCAITPGGGKSLLPVIAASQLIPQIADRICWVVPRRALQLQAEAEFLKPHGRQLLQHAYSIRRSTNEADPARGLSGFATTYQAIGVGNKHLVEEFRRRRYILVLDEPHHVEEGGAWEAALHPLVQRAALTVFMSGTLERGNRKRIAFLPYRYSYEGQVVDLGGDESTLAVAYSRRDALRERAILPIHFELMDGTSQWIGRDGETYNVQLSDAGKDTQEALYTALKTQFAEQLLNECAAHWANYRQTHPRSKLLVVTANIEDAKKYVAHLSGKGIKAAIATSDDSVRAQANIEKYKLMGSAGLDALVTVAMAYEGLDVPPITHIACLTHIRSKPWIEQMLARATRYDAGAGDWDEQMAHVYVPDDRNMVSIIEAMQDEQIKAVKGASRDDDLDGEMPPSPPTPPEERNAIVPVGSEAGPRRWSQVGTMSLFAEDAPIALIETQTPSQAEATLREAIQSHCKQIDLLRFEKKWGETNNRVIKQFGKKRAQMTLDELRTVQTWLQANYPVEEAAPVRVVAPPKVLTAPSKTLWKVPTRRAS